MSNSFYSIGISHWNCPLEIRELFNIDKSQSTNLIHDIKALGGSGFSISTCNRTQVFASNTNVYQLKELFIKHSDKINRVTFWGVMDKYSWLNDWPIKGRTNYPLLFDRNYQPKVAYERLLDVNTKP